MICTSAKNFFNFEMCDIRSHIPRSQQEGRATRHYCCRQMDGLQATHIFLCTSKWCWTSTRRTYRVSAFSQTSFPLTAIALPSLPWAWNSHNSNVFDNKGKGDNIPLMNINADGMASRDAFPFSLTDQPTAKIYYLAKHRARA